MPTSHAIAPHLPYLRRYARGLTGSQSSGDAYVRAALESILAAREQLDDSLSPRVALYRVFHVVWSGSALPAGMTEMNGGKRHYLDENLAKLEEGQREALLLTDMENFSHEEAAAIIGVTPEKVDELVAKALDRLTKQPPTSVLIIEDEPIISLDLSDILEEMGHSVAAVAVTRDEAVAAAQKTPPGLILADIQLADKSSGLDAVDEILTKTDVPVIYITAYPERLLTGEREEPTFLINKPFAAESVKAIVSQALLLAEKGLLAQHRH